MTHENSTTHDPEDIRKGVDWWDGLTDAERGYWRERAESPIPADAWRLYKRQLLEDRGHE